MIGDQFRNWADPIPRPALLLGMAGLLPFVTSTALLLTGPGQDDMIWRTVLLAYGVAILSFMGGVQWGLSMRQAGQEGHTAWLGYGASVVPALVGWVAFLMPPLLQLPLLMVGFVLLLIYDLGSVRRGAAPTWYRNLRWPLTVIVTACLALASFA